MSTTETTQTQPLRLYKIVCEVEHPIYAQGHDVERREHILFVRGLNNLDDKIKACAKLYDNQWDAEMKGATVYECGDNDDLNDDEIILTPGTLYTNTELIAKYKCWFADVGEHYCVQRVNE